MSWTSCRPWRFTCRIVLLTCIMSSAYCITTQSSVTSTVLFSRGNDSSALISPSASSVQNITSPVDTETTTSTSTRQTEVTDSGNHDNTSTHDPMSNTDPHSSNGVNLVPVHFEHVKYPVVFSIVVIFAALSKLVFHFSHVLSSKVPESW